MESADFPRRTPLPSLPDLIPEPYDKLSCSCVRGLQAAYREVMDVCKGKKWHSNEFPTRKDYLLALHDELYCQADDLLRFEEVRATQQVIFAAAVLATEYRPRHWWYFIPSLVFMFCAVCVIRDLNLWGAILMGFSVVCFWPSNPKKTNKHMCDVFADEFAYACGVIQNGIDYSDGTETGDSDV